MKKLTLSLVLLLVAGTALAQPGHGRGPRQGGPMHGGPEQWGDKPPREMVEAFRLFKLTEFLELSEEQTAQIYPRIAEMNRLRDEQRDAMQEKMEELRELVKEDKYGKGAKLADQIHEMRGEMHTRQHEMMGEMLNLLSDEQRAKFALFEQRFEKHLHRVAETMDRRHEGRQAPGPRAPRDW